MAESTADIIAKTVLTQFNKLSAKRKPKVRDNGLHEWVPISGIVAEEDGNFTCISLATGMKCLPSSKIPEANGIGLHDWHAEILTIRTFNRYILDECFRLMDGHSSNLLERVFPSDNLLRLRPQPFRLRCGVRLHMYASEAPCGDASMENLMAAQEDASPWDLPAQQAGDDAHASSSSSQQQLPGRAYFSQLGVVRRKPARSDAPPTLSKSCSDKLALKQCTSLLASLTSLVVDPSSVYIDTLVLPDDQYSAVACQRAFAAGGRMRSVGGGEILDGTGCGYCFRPFVVQTTAVQFAYSRRAVLSRSDRIAASNLAVAWSLAGMEESILGGVVQGHKAFLDRGASRMSRRRTWQSCRELAAKLADHWPTISEQLSVETYSQVKNGPLLDARNKVKSHVREVALIGWIRNTGDDIFSIE